MTGPVGRRARRAVREQRVALAHVAEAASARAGEVAQWVTLHEAADDRLRGGAPLTDAEREAVADLVATMAAALGRVIDVGAAPAALPLRGLVEKRLADAVGTLAAEHWQTAREPAR